MYVAMTSPCENAKWPVFSCERTSEVGLRTVTISRMDARKYEESTKRLLCDSCVPMVVANAAEAGYAVAVEQSSNALWPSEEVPDVEVEGS